jgi:ribonuclease HI
LALKRLKMLSPQTARQLFVATVAPVMDYAANVWMHACGEKVLGWLNRAQKTGALAITGAFRTVATTVAEAEASILPIRERHAQGAVRLWINIHTLPKTHPLALKKIRTTVRFMSPVQKIARMMEGIQVDRMEIIREHAIPPWEPRLQTIQEPDREKAAEMANEATDLMVATSSSVKEGIVGMGGIAQDNLFSGSREIVVNYAVTLGTREEQNPYTAELAAIAMALKSMPPRISHRHITIVTRNQSALAAIRQPRQQSGQGIITQIYESVKLLKQRGNSIDFRWAPAESNFALGSEAKAAAQRATKEVRTPDSQPYQAKSTTMRLAMTKQRRGRMLPQGVGKFSKAMDTALPGKHTRVLYDKLKRREACVLAQLRTGMAKLNGFLSRIGAAESDLCACGHAKETVEHFLLRCIKWTALRDGLLQCTETRRGSLSFYLGGKAPSDPKVWMPDMKAVRATIKYAMATGRLERDDEQALDRSQ